MLVEGAASEGGKGPSIWDAFAHTKDGLGTQVNKEGIMYYNNLINYLLEKGIEPCVTLYHWDLPLYLYESMGGWLSHSVVVKRWITINEPLETAVNGYSTGVFAPGKRNSHSAEPYLVAHHQLLAHAEAVSIYKTKFQDLQGGEIGLVVDCEWAEALTDNEEDIAAAARRIDFQLGWFLDPIFFGEYPISMQERVGDKLPLFCQKDKELLRNSLDFVGLNHYTSRFVSHCTNKEKNDYYSAQEATRIGMDDEDNVASPIEKMLDDKLRVSYFKGYLESASLAIRDGVDVRGYFVWSLVDNFEWCFGFTKRFGLVYVDYINGLTRHPKSSAYWLSKFLKGEDGENGKEDYRNI
ncbi:hypothetical protein M8C21_005151 [Ambrosia artemisiifolia]|uniref:Uncharacterized protein n=1 Tax=Ambrosia artemisiifolia TaxID=4212 RepID=A0AAD5BMW5_AMBAR|nr:hypothetical protein M8C21_005151 [Ambrosia artemisiifolia]